MTAKATLFVFLVTIWSALGWVPGANKQTASSNKNLLKNGIEQVRLSAWGFSDTGGYGVLWGVPGCPSTEKTTPRRSSPRSSVKRACTPESFYFDGMGGEASCWAAKWVHPRRENSSAKVDYMIKIHTLVHAIQICNIKHLHVLDDAYYNIIP